MPAFTTQPINEVSQQEFKELLYGKEVILSDHALVHLSRQQRKVFKDEELLSTVNRENPRKVYLQQNGRYAAYFRKSDGYRKVIIETENDTAVIVSFMDVDELPTL